MVCVPAVSEEVAQLALPLASGTFGANLALPSAHVMVPVGELPATVATKVTAWPTVEVPEVLLVTVTLLATAPPGGGVGYGGGGEPIRP